MLPIVIAPVARPHLTTIPFRCCLQPMLAESWQTCAGLPIKTRTSERGRHAAFCDTVWRGRFTGKNIKNALAVLY